MRLSSALPILCLCLPCLSASSRNSFRQRPLQSPLDPRHSSETVTLDPTWFSDDSTDSTTILIDGSDVQALVPDPSDSDSTDLNDVITQSLQNSLPFLLQQFGIDDSDVPGIVADGIPLMISCMIEAFGGSEGDSSRHSYDLSDGVGNWISNIVAKGATKIVQTGDPNVNCGVFASAAVTGYTAVKNLLATLNPLSTPVPTTSDEDFLIFPLHGSISHDDGILVYKGATLPPGFGTTEGVTMGKIIYSIFDPSDAVVSGSNFAKSAGLLLHEFTHTKQYKALGYDTNAFGTKYMFQFCKGGFHYLNIAFESEAFATAKLMDKLRLDPIGSQFLVVYDARGLDIGLPTARTYSPDPSTPNVYNLPMQAGTLSITCTTDTPPVCS